MSKTITCLLPMLLLVSYPASAIEHRVGIGVDCDNAMICFNPATLTIRAGDQVTFYIYGDAGDLGEPHNVVADDGSFRCAQGCDGEKGGDGTPAAYPTQWHATRTFDTPGIVRYHDEVSHASGVIIVRDAASFAISPGMSGNWFNPAQNGHGFILEVLAGPPMKLLASWFVFGPQGGQSWVQALGPIDGDRAVLQAHQALGSGGRFPPRFDAANVRIESWGTLTFTFSDCDHAHVDWTSTTLGYGTGQMDLVRLTRPAGLACL